MARNPFSAFIPRRRDIAEVMRELAQLNLNIDERAIHLDWPHSPRCPYSISFCDLQGSRESAIREFATGALQVGLGRLVKIDASLSSFVAMLQPELETLTDNVLPHVAEATDRLFADSRVQPFLHDGGLGQGFLPGLRHLTLDFDEISGPKSAEPGYPYQVPDIIEAAQKPFDAVLPLLLRRLVPFARKLDRITVKMDRQFAWAQSVLLRAGFVVDFAEVAGEVVSSPQCEDSARCQPMRCNTQGTEYYPVLYTLEWTVFRNFWRQRGRKSAYNLEGLVEGSSRADASPRESDSVCSRPGATNFV